MTPPLPLLLDPEPGEAWHSYLTRRAAQHHCTVTELADTIGLRRDGRWPPYHGLTINAGLRDHVAPLLSLAPAAVYELHLARYDQLAFDLTGLLNQPGINSTRTVAARHWTWLAGSTYCPACLAAGGVWRQTWRLPWITTCPEHETALVDRCPACGGVPGLGNSLHASAPHRVSAAPDGRLCTRPDGPDICAADLSKAPAVGADAPRVARTRLVIAALTSGYGTVLGRHRTSLQMLTAWQAAIGIAVRLGAIDSLQLGGWGRTHRQINPPRDPSVMDQLIATVEPVVSAPNVSAGAAILERWCLQAGISTPHRQTFSRIRRPSAALQPAIDELLARHGRVHTRLQRRLTTELGRPVPDLGYTVDDVPQLAWPCCLPPAWRDSSKPDQRILRAVIAMGLVRAVNGGDWIDAGAALGIPADKARNWTRYAFSSRFGHLRTDLVETTITTSSALKDGPVTRQWARRPPIRGYGAVSLAAAQQPRCGVDDPGGWCPCNT